MDNRIQGLDYLRVAAVFSVVWIHGSDTSHLAKSFQDYTAFAVPCFIMMAIFLGQDSISRKKPELLRYVGIRAKRLIPAYMAWTCAYLLLRFLKRQFISHVSFELDPIAVFLFGGASYQLWFVPALLIWTLAFAPLMLKITNCRNKVAIATVLILSALLCFWVGFEIRPMVHVSAGYEMIGYMIGQTGYVPAALGIWLLYRDKPSWFEKWALRMTLFIVLMAVLLKIWKPGMWYSPIYSTMVFCLSLSLSAGKIGDVVSRISAVSFGIFLCHGIFVEGFQVAAGFLNMPLDAFSATVLIIMASFTASVLICACLSKYTATRWLVA